MRVRDALYRRALAFSDGLAVLLVLVLVVGLGGGTALRWPAMVVPLLIVAMDKVAGLYDHDSKPLRRWGTIRASRRSVGCCAGPRSTNCPSSTTSWRGTMSLVGPRPLVPDEDRAVEGWRRRRLELAPGMTGPWQVLGSTRVPLNQMVKMDYLYIANWSPWADVKALLLTLPHVLGRRGL